MKVAEELGIKGLAAEEPQQAGEDSESQPEHEVECAGEDSVCVENSRESDPASDVLNVPKLMDSSEGCCSEVIFFLLVIIF